VVKARLIKAVRERSDWYFFYRDKVKPLALKFKP
jgi:hypothetical protein